MREILIGFTDFKNEECAIYNYGQNKIYNIETENLIKNIKSGDIKLENAVVSPKNNIQAIAKNKIHSISPNWSEGLFNFCYILESEPNKHTVVNQKGQLSVLNDEEINQLLFKWVMNPFDCIIKYDIKAPNKNNKYSGELVREGYNKIDYVYKVNKLKGKLVYNILSLKGIKDTVIRSTDLGELELDLNKGISNVDGIAIYNNDSMLVGKAFIRSNSILENVLLDSKYFLNTIDERIKEYGIKNYNKASINNIYNIPEPTKSNPYEPIVVYNKDIINGGRVSNSTVSNLYKQKLDIIKPEVWLDIPTRDGSIAVKRELNDNAIYYLVMELNDAGKAIRNRRLFLEEIYNNIEDYSNVVLDGSIMTVYGIDGVYKYDMDKVLDVYNNTILDSSKSSRKAKILGIQHKEKVTDQGLLVELDTTSHLITIPKNATSIEKNSIIIYKDTEEITFHSKIERIKGGAFVFRRSTGLSLNKINIECEDLNARLSLSKFISKVSRISGGSKLTLDYSVNISDKELIQFVANRADIKKLDIVAPNLIAGSKETDEIVNKFFKGVMELSKEDFENLGNDEVYKKSILKKPDYVYGIKTNIAEIYSMCFILEMKVNSIKHLIDMASSPVKDKIYSIIDKLRDKIKSEAKRYEVE